MAFSVGLRRATAALGSSVRPSLYRRLLSRAEPSRLPCFCALARFSSFLRKKLVTDAELLRIVESEIGCAMDECNEVVEVPEDFPFEIQDDKGTNVITLRRDYWDENIEVVVSMPTVEDGDVSEDVGDKENHGDDEKANQPTIPLTVNISKGSGSNLEFCCTAYAEDIVIDSVCIRGNKESEEDLLAYEGPNFNDLDDNLQKAFHKYLETRGISPPTTNFLYDYLICKDGREYLLWLQNVKHFLDK